MMIDTKNLKALAEASGLDEWYSAGDLRYCDDKNGEIHGLHHDDGRFIAAASPTTVLALLAEIDRLESEATHTAAGVQSDREQRDQLKAENEALRRDAERYRFVRNPIGTSSPLAIWNEGKMPLFSSIADAVVDEFMTKEANHG